MVSWKISGQDPLWQSTVKVLARLGCSVFGRGSANRIAVPELAATSEPSLSFEQSGSAEESCGSAGLYHIPYHTTPDYTQLYSTTLYWMKRYTYQKCVRQYILRRMVALLWLPSSPSPAPALNSAPSSLFSLQAKGQ